MGFVVQSTVLRARKVRLVEGSTDIYSVQAHAMSRVETNVILATRGFSAAAMHSNFRLALDKGSHSMYTSSA